MRDFLINDHVNMAFELFDPLHLIVVLSFIIGFGLIIYNKNKIKNLSDSTKRKISMFVVVLMFINMKIWYISKLYYGTYNLEWDLPFHFCFISGYIFMYAIAFKKPKLYKVAYFFAFMGPVPAMIWPDLKGGLDVFVFYQYYISHHLFLMANMFVYYAYDVTMNKKDAFAAFKVANVIFITMAIYNVIFKTNYIMSSRLPEQILELYPFLNQFNYPFILLEITGIVIIALAYIPIYFQNKRKIEKINKNSLQQRESLL